MTRAEKCKALRDEAFLKELREAVELRLFRRFCTAKDYRDRVKASHTLSAVDEAIAMISGWANDNG